MFQLVVGGWSTVRLVASEPSSTRLPSPETPSANEPQPLGVHPDASSIESGSPPSTLTLTRSAASGSVPPLPVDPPSLSRIVTSPTLAPTATPARDTVMPSKNCARSSGVVLGMILNFRTLLCVPAAYVSVRAGDGW